MTIADARAYVGTVPASGWAQWALLKFEGLTPQANVLEIGCGALHAAAAIVPTLEGQYVGIDPNEWLRDAARDANPELDAILRDHRARFLSVDDFDASHIGMVSFDYVLSHSVLSHASADQLGQWMGAVARVLAPRGRAVASLRLGTVDTNAADWTYPAATFFTRETVEVAAHLFGLELEWHPEYREFYSAIRPDEIHDWAVIHR